MTLHVSTPSTVLNPLAAEFVPWTHKEQGRKYTGWGRGGFDMRPKRQDFPCFLKPGGPACNILDAPDEVPNLPVTPDDFGLSSATVSTCAAKNAALLDPLNQHFTTFAHPSHIHQAASKLAKDRAPFAHHTVTTNVVERENLAKRLIEIHFAAVVCHLAEAQRPC